MNVDQRVAICATCYQPVDVDDPNGAGGQHDPGVCRMAANSERASKGFAPLTSPIIFFHAEVIPSVDSKETQKSYYDLLHLNKRIKRYEETIEKLTAELWFMRWACLGLGILVMVITLMMGRARS